MTTTSAREVNMNNQWNESVQAGDLFPIIFIRSSRTIH